MSSKNNPASWHLNCPVPIPANAECVTLAHGEGGRLSRKLIQEHIIDYLNNEYLIALNDAAQLPKIEGPLALTTDSFVVSPLFFREAISAHSRFLVQSMTWLSVARNLSGSHFP